MVSSEKKTILRTLDGEEFKVEEATARQSEMYCNIIDDGCMDNMIPLNVNARTLAKVIKYRRKHAVVTRAVDDDGNADKEINHWDAAYIDVDQATLYDVLLAASDLDIKGLLDLVCDKLANMIRGKSAEEIRKIFNIKNDLTPEEEEEIRK